MNKYIKYGVLLLILGLLAYRSVYFEKLSTRKQTSAATFDAAAFSKKLWAEQLPAKLDSAVELSQLMNAVQKNAPAAFEQYTHALAIGNYRYALVKLEATVTAVREDEVMLHYISGDSILQVSLATEFIYGNAIRDASGLVDIKDFPNSNDLNSVSEALNKIVRTTIVPAFKQKIKKDDRISLVAAVELNKEHVHWQGLELLPLRLTIP